jgi:hypothetical protein
MYRYLTLLLALIPAMASAQNSGRISGRIVDAQNAPVVANVVLMSPDSNKLVKTELADEQGNYLLEHLRDGKYVIKVTAMNYVSYSSDTFLLSGNKQMPDIVLAKTSKELKEVNVSAVKPLIEIKADRIVLNVDNSAINTGSSVLEVIGRAPGVRVDQNDNISLKGKPGVMIMIDGKRVPVAGADLANMLKSMPSSTVDKIEVITNPGARYDAAGSGGIINIKMKKDQRLGLNGNVNATYAQGVYGKPNAGGSLNYRNRKFNVNTGYNYSWRKGFNSLDITRQFYTDNVVRTTYTQKNRTYFPVWNHIANAGIDYYVSSKTTVGVSGNGYSSRFNPTGDNSSRVDSGDTYTFFTTSNRSKEAWYNYAINGYLKHTFDSTGKELSIDLDYARFWNQNYQLFTNKYYNSDNDFLQPDYLIYGDLKGVTQIRSFKADYVHPLKNGLKLEGGIKLSYVTADNEPIYYDVSTKDTLTDNTKTNHFVYDEHINAAYVNGNKDIDNWSVQIGVRAEQTIAKGDQRTTGEKFNRNYVQLFPSFATQYHINKRNDIGLTLSRRIDRPSYRQLNPFKFFLDPTNFRVGNPYLQPALTYSFELSHTYKQRFLTTFGYSIMSGVITEVLQPNPERQNESFQIDRNLDKMYSYSFGIAYPIQVTKWWASTTNGNAYYNTFSGYLANTSLQKSAPAFDINTTNSFKVTKWLNTEVAAFYQSRQIWGYYNLNAIWSLNIGITANMLKNKLTFRGGVNDLFWSSNQSADIRFRDFGERFKAKRDSRIFSVSLMYRFGNSKAGQSRRRNGGADDEKRRAGGGGA